VSTLVDVSLRILYASVVVEGIDPCFTPYSARIFSLSRRARCIISVSAVVCRIASAGRSTDDELSI
jgi:hypothetical protein